MLTGCGNNEIKTYDKEEQMKTDLAGLNKEDDNVKGNENNKNEIMNKDEASSKNEISNKNKESNKNENSNKNESISFIGSYQNKSKTENYYHESNIIIKNQTDNLIEFAINAVHGKDENNVNLGTLEGTAKKIGDKTYVFVDNTEGIDYEIKFTFSTNKQFINMKVEEKKSNGYSPYGNNVYVEGDYESNESVNILDEYGNIYLTSKIVNESDFKKYWYTAEQPKTELSVEKDGTFSIKSSKEAKGKYIISGTKVYFTNNNGEKWEGEILMQQAGNYTMRINFEDIIVYLYDGEGD